VAAPATGGPRVVLVCFYAVLCEDKIWAVLVRIYRQRKSEKPKDFFFDPVNYLSSLD
jgi:hypothetical protein